MSHDRDREDATIVSRGDHARLLAKYEPVIVGRCIAELRGHLDADDVAQDVKLRLWGELCRGKAYSVPFRVVVHKVIWWTVKEYFAGKPTHGPLPEGWDPADPDDVYGDLLDDDAVSAAFDALPDGKTRAVMEMRYLERLDPEQIAERLGITRNAVDQALHRGHAKLRETFPRG
jgi:RNA polymerase sigma factor (sigma-70 family)